MGKAPAKEYKNLETSISLKISIFIGFGNNILQLILILFYFAGASAAL